MLTHSVSVPPPVTAVAHNRPQSFCQKCRWPVTPKHVYTLHPSKLKWADYATVQAECGKLSGNELTRNSLGKTWSQSSQLAELLCTDPGLKSGISLRELISTLKKKRKKVQAGNELCEHSPKTLAHKEKATPTRWLRGKV